MLENVGKKYTLYHDKLSTKEIIIELSTWKILENEKDFEELKKFELIRYIRKKTRKYKRECLLIHYDKKNRYVLLKSRISDIKWSVKIDEVILFKKN